MQAHKICNACETVAHCSKHGCIPLLGCSATATKQPADPMDWPLPCDVTVGHGTIGKGVPLRTLVNRMKVLYGMATGNDADEIAHRTPEQNQALTAAFVASVQAAAPPARQAGAADATTPQVVATAPRRIYLDLGFDPAEENAPFSELHEITWSSNNASGHGVEYVRADLAVLDCAQAGDQGAAMDAALWRYALTDGGNQRMNWQDIYDKWDGEGEFSDAMRRAMDADERTATAAKAQKGSAP